MRDGSGQKNQGLSGASAAELLQIHGPNELPGTRPRHLLRIAREVLGEPMFLLLIVAAGIYVVLGEAREAMALSASMIIIVVISIVQERRTEHALAKLRELSSPRALVVRDGIELRIAGQEVVPGDIVMLREGDRVPADALLLSATALSVDESILTGESLAIDKSAAPNRDCAGRLHQVFSGSLIVRGYGVAEVFATGPRSDIGKIGKALAALGTETTPLFKEVRRIVRWVALAAIALCASVAGIYAVTRNDWLGGVLAGITLAMGVLPEEFPVVLTVFLAFGAWRMSRQGVLTRRMPAIESMGAVTLLAVDKTGTLTENRMRVAMIEIEERRFDLRRDAVLDAGGLDVLRTALAASEQQAFDPMERAIHEAAAALAPQALIDMGAMQLVREYDLTPQLLAVTHVWRRPGDAHFEIAVKGAPETVFRLCRLPATHSEAHLARVAALAGEGLRVLAVARGRYANDSMPESPDSFELQLLGLLCLADPLRAEVPAALAECAAAGIRVVMITGDHPGTALAIARQAGFDSLGDVLTGAQLASLEEPALRERVRTTCVYARMSPEHKLRLVQALKANGEIVAMTGDGVNDAPALKAAHVGVAMGGRGTDVAREAASIVLLNDDFASLVGTVRSGRRIYDNLRHAMAFIVAVHVPIAGMGLFPVLFGWPLLLFPLHVLFLEFVIDPACSFVFEADQAATDIMRRQPRPANARLFSAALLRRSILMGAIILAFVVAVYAIALALLAVEQARALSFIALIIADLALIFVNRAPDESITRLIVQPNRIFWGIAAITLLVLITVIYLPVLAQAFQFAAPPPAATLAIFAAGAAVVLCSGALLRRWRASA